MAEQMESPQPRAERPGMATGYGIKREPDGMLAWDWAAEGLTASRNYWIATTRGDGRPHVAPVWGVWHDGALWFGTDVASAKGRNIARSPEVVAHLESGDDVVILEGAAEEATAPAAADDAYAAKYAGIRLTGSPAGSVIYRLRPRLAHGWLETDYPNTATRWRFA